MRLEKCETRLQSRKDESVIYHAKTEKSSMHFISVEMMCTRVCDIETMRNTIPFWLFLDTVKLLDYKYSIEEGLTTVSLM